MANIKEKMTTKTTKKTQTSIIVVTGLIAVFAFSVFSLSSQTLETDSQITVKEPPAGPDALLPHEMPYRSGLPVLEAIEVENPRLDNLEFQPLKQGEHEYIWRAIENGATYLSERELEHYFTQIKEPMHRFSFDDGEGVQYYRLAYTEPKLDYDTHRIKILEYAEERDLAFKALDAESKSILELPLDKPYRWHYVDAADALVIKQKIDAEGNYFTAPTDHGVSKFQIWYLGPFSDYYQNADFQETLESRNE